MTNRTFQSKSGCVWRVRRGVREWRKWNSKFTKLKKVKGYPSDAPITSETADALSRTLKGLGWIEVDAIENNSEK